MIPITYLGTMYKMKKYIWVQKETIIIIILIIISLSIYKNERHFALCIFFTLWHLQIRQQVLKFVTCELTYRHF